MAKEKDYNIHVKVPGVEQAKTDLDRVSAASQKLTDTIDQGNKKQADGYEKADAKSESYFGKIGKWAIGLIGVSKAIGEITKAIQMQTAALEENARVAESQQNSLLRLQFLGEFFKEKPELRQEVAAYAEYGRRPFEQVAGAYYNLRSKAGNLSKEQQSSIMQEALEMGRTDPAVELNTLVDMFSLYAKLTGEKDMNKVQNVLQKTVEQAGSNGADVANYMPQFLPIGLSGGLSGAQSAGLWSYVTTQTASPSIATTGLRATFMGLQGKGSPESAKMLKKYGVSDNQSFTYKINTLSAAYKSGKFDLAAAEQIAGREGASILLSMLQNPDDMNKIIGNVVGADRGDIDITGSMINELMGSDPTARSEENIRLLNIAIANQKANDPKALQAEELKRRMEYDLRRGDVSPYNQSLANNIVNTFLGLGMDPNTMASFDPNDVESAKNQGILPKNYLSGGTTIINNNNVVYNRGETPAKPRVTQKDVE
jgi:hypothetical protein